MLKRDDVIAFIYKTIGNDLLDKALMVDEVANGVQFLGAEEIEKISLGVSLNEEFLYKAAKNSSNFCIFHHGFDPRTWKSRYSLSAQKRLKIIINNKITIVGLHYSLDAHPEIGNNAQIINKLGAKIKASLFEDWGYVAVFDKEQDIHDLAHSCQEIFNHDVLVIAGGSDKVKTIGVVSGAAKPHDAEIAEMEAKGVELFISGETSESTIHKMKESGINYFICGHYATEVFGVKALGDKIKKEFGEKIDVDFIDIKNPI